MAFCKALGRSVSCVEEQHQADRRETECRQPVHQEQTHEWNADPVGRLLGDVLAHVALSLIIGESLAPRASPEMRAS